MEDGEWVSKPCSRCHAVLPLEQFYPRKGHTPSALCRPCTNIVTAAHNKTVPEKRRIYNHRWYAKRKEVMPNASK
jgi:3-mercaptopyruvate sulfurtransferase SseA